MRRLLTAVASVLTATAATGTVAAQAPTATPDYASATNDTSSVVPGVPGTMRRAAAYVAMASQAPLAAPNVLASRQARGAARDASAAYETALANYNAGYGDAARREADRAIALAQVALAATVDGGPGVVGEVSGGEITISPPITPPRPIVSMAATATPLPLPRSYGDLTSLPHGVTPAGPGAPFMRDSLPYGVTPVVPSGR
jgi:hypothetical protein